MLVVTPSSYFLPTLCLYSSQHDRDMFTGWAFEHQCHAGESFRTDDSARSLVQGKTSHVLQTLMSLVQLTVETRFYSQYFKKLPALSCCFRGFQLHSLKQVYFPSKMVLSYLVLTLVFQIGCADSTAKIIMIAYFNVQGLST